MTKDSIHRLDNALIDFELDAMLDPEINSLKTREVLQRCAELRKLLPDLAKEVA